MAVGELALKRSNTCCTCTHVEIVGGVVDVISGQQGLAINRATAFDKVTDTAFDRGSGAIGVGRDRGLAIGRQGPGCVRRCTIGRPSI